MAAAPVQTSPLLRKLSPELLNPVYDLVILEVDDIDVATEQQPGLTRTCREIRSETIRIYFQDNTFSYNTTSGGNDGLDGMKKSLQHITPAHCATLGGIKVRIGVENGLMIHDYKAENDPWSLLVQHMKAMQCPAHIALEVSVLRTAKPSDSFLITLQRLMEHGDVQRWFDSLEGAVWHYFHSLATEYLEHPPDITYQVATMGAWDVLMLRRYHAARANEVVFGGRAIGRVGSQVMNEETMRLGEQTERVAAARAARAERYG